MPKVSYKKLIDGVQKIIERGDYIECLKMMKKLENHKYSFRNSVLIYLQNPNATIVKGFVGWQKLGRGIKNHPKSIYIYYPIKQKAGDRIEGQQNLDGTEYKVRNQQGTMEVIDEIIFRRMVVFDIGDTYLHKGAKRVPILEDKINNNTTSDFYEILKSISKCQIIEKEDTNGYKGYYDKSQNKIFVNSNLTQDDKTATLLHEMTHSLYDDFVYKDERQKSEIFVESVAFLVADYFNFDTSLCSFGYITHWAKDNINEVLNLGRKIQDTSKEFIELIESKLDNQLKISA